VEVSVPGAAGRPGASVPPALTVMLATFPVPASVPPAFTVAALAMLPVTERVPPLIVVAPA
jgi:hypothetical protein